MYLDVYQWEDSTLPVVYRSRNARNALIERLERSTETKVGARLVKVSLDDVEAVLPEHANAIAGWKRGLEQLPAMLATGFTAAAF